MYTIITNKIINKLLCKYVNIMMQIGKKMFKGVCDDVATISYMPRIRYVGTMIIFDDN